MYISNSRIENIVSNDDILWCFVSNNVVVIKFISVYKFKFLVEIIMVIIEIFLIILFDVLLLVMVR